MSQRILIVEDEPEFAALLERWITHAGYEVIVGRTGHEALRQFYDRRPDLVGLDSALKLRRGFRLGAAVITILAICAIWLIRYYIVYFLIAAVGAAFFLHSGRKLSAISASPTLTAIGAPSWARSVKRSRR